MSPEPAPPPAVRGAAPRLSICIATLNRAEFIGETLGSIVAQLSDEVEVVVVDGNSRDRTAEVVGAFTADPRVRYFREPDNSGVDADYDKAVGYARGDWVWLMTDDDVLRDGALDRVLQATTGPERLVVLNTCVLDHALRHTLLARHIRVDADRRVDLREPADRALAAECLRQMTFIGCVVTERAAWLARDRARWYGSLFVHVGTLFQAPATAALRVLAEPLVAIRYGNAMWTPRSFEIWNLLWPGLVWSLEDLPEALRAAVVRREPWRQPALLLLNRATGAYSRAQYERFLRSRTRGASRAWCWGVARLPAGLLAALGLAFFALFKRHNRIRIHDLAASPACPRWARAAVRAAGLAHLP